MKIKGIVNGINQHIGRYSIWTDYGYVVADLVDGEIHHRDVLYGCLDEHGSVVVLNQTTGEHVELYLEAIQASEANARHLLQIG